MNFEFNNLPLPGLLLIKSKIFSDNRGLFYENYQKSIFQKYGLPDFLQDNTSISSEGVLRGLHFQKDPLPQGKLVSVLRGKVWDVAVDLRNSSPTFGQWFGLELTEKDGNLFYIPPGFAHGFVSLAPGTIFSYKCTNEYDKNSDTGILWNDPTLNISWPINNPILSEKDLLLPNFSPDNLYYGKK